MNEKKRCASNSDTLLLMNKLYEEPQLKKLFGKGLKVQKINITLLGRTSTVKQYHKCSLIAFHLNEFNGHWALLYHICN